MKMCHSLTIIDTNKELIAHGVYSTRALARQALSDFVDESSDICRPSNWPDDWYLEPTAFGFATELLEKLKYRWFIIDLCTIDPDTPRLIKVSELR